MIENNCMTKINLHFHTGDDTKDCIQYTTQEAIDYAVSLGYSALAITCHRTVEWTEEYAGYARGRGLLLISGIELEVADETGRRSDVLVLNCDISAEAIDTFTDLRTYKEKHPKVFVVAPHPFFYGNFSLQENLITHIDIFDAIEHSWFYTQNFNRNQRAEEIAKQFNKPFIATSDAHWLSALQSDYARLTDTVTTPEEVFSAIRHKRFQNVTQPKSMCGTFGRFGVFAIKNRFLRLWRKYLGRE
jgi:predicted metal-dependent phosphoesterase TrpH